MTKLEEMTINLFCDYVLKAQIANITINKADDAGDEKKLEKAWAHQKEMYRAAEKILDELLVCIEPQTVWDGIEAWNKANEANYDGTSYDELRKVDIPDRIVNAVTNRK